MTFSYYHQFHLSEDLAEALSTFISQKEEGNLVCKAIQVTIPEHKGLVFSSPLGWLSPLGWWFECP